MKGYNIPRKGDMFPDSIRESPIPNESSQASWHDRNFPKIHVSNIQSKISKFQNFINISPQVEKYFTPSGTSTPAQTGKLTCKLTSTDTAKGGSQVQHSDPQNHEVMVLTNNVQKGVLINTSKEETENAKNGSQVQHPEIQNLKVKTIINNVRKSVLNDTFKDETERSNVPG